MDPGKDRHAPLQQEDDDNAFNSNGDEEDDDDEKGNEIQSDDEEGFDLLDGLNYEEDLNVSDPEERIEEEEDQLLLSDESIQFIAEVKSTRNLSVKVEEEDDDDALLSQALDDAERKQGEVDKINVDKVTSTVCDTKYVPTSFTTLLSREQWKRVIIPATINVDDDTFTWYQVNKGSYNDPLQEAFSKKITCCVLAFSKAEVRQPHQTGRVFFRCYGACTGEQCKARYSFNVRDVTPIDCDNVTLNVRKTTVDDIKHLTTERLARQLKGEKRLEMKQKLITQKPFRVLTDAYAKGDPKQLQFGNINVVKTLKVLQQARVEVRHSW